MSGAQFNGYISIFTDYRNANQTGSARGAVLMTRAAYANHEFTTQDGTVITKPDLRANTQSVYVRGQRTLLTANTNPLLLQSPIDLTLHSATQLPNHIKSVLLNNRGQVLDKTENRFGYLTAFAKNSDQDGGECTPANAVLNNDNDLIYSTTEGITPCAPIANPTLHTWSVLFSTEMGAIGDQNGIFNMLLMYPGCPNFQFEYKDKIWLKMWYADFNPRRQAPLWLAEPRTIYTFCSGIGSIAHPLFPMPTPKAPEMNFSEVPFPVEVIAVTGEGDISNRWLTGQANNALAFAAGEDGDTTYTTDLPLFTEQIPVGLDLDADGTTDNAILHEGKVYVYLGGRQVELDDEGNPINEDLVRAPDTLTQGGVPDTSHQGLVSIISKQDLRETDLYVYRQSNGKRIAELRGLQEWNYNTETGANTTPNTFRDGIGGEDGNWYYRMHIASGFVPETRGVIGFLSDATLDDGRYEREADHLQIGETLRIIAINRKTGYMGSVMAEVKEPQNGIISFPIPKIELRPPNLRITAERKYIVEAGATAGQVNRHINNNEDTHN